MSDQSKKVFISYRRSASRHLARLIFMDLKEKGFDPFLDVNDIDSGTFDTIILNQIAARPHFIIVLSPGSIERFIEPDDWLRREVEMAMDLQRNIVLVMEEGFTFEGKRDYLPGKLQQLPRFNGFPLFHYYFDAAMELLRERFLKLPTYNIDLEPTPPQEEAEIQNRIKEVTSKTSTDLGISDKKNPSPEEVLETLVKNLVSQPKQGLIIQPLFGQPLSGFNADIFMIAPFAEHIRPVYQDHIVHIAQQLNLIVKRGDDFFSHNSIIQEVWSAINTSRIIIADVTGRNSNVFYELGMAHTLGKQTIIITQNLDDVPFDIRHLRVLVYSYTPRGMALFETQLKNALKLILNLIE